MAFLQLPIPSLATSALCLLLAAFIIGKRLLFRPRKSSVTPPAVPGWPLIGNLLQLREKKPYLTFAKWAEAHGPIYSIRLGSSTMVVLNTTELAKETITRVQTCVQTETSTSSDVRSASEFVRTGVRTEPPTGSDVRTAIEIARTRGSDVIFVPQTESYDHFWDITDMCPTGPYRRARRTDKRDRHPTSVVLQALVTKFSSISTRKLSNALTILTCNKAIVAMSDYGEYHKMVKQYVLSAVLGANAQKRNRHHRDTMIENVVNNLTSKVKDKDCCLVELREPFQSELFRLALKQSLGKDVESIYVEELGVTFSKNEIFQILVIDPMVGAIEVDWRDFFPYFRWIPNKRIEMKIQQMATRKRAVTKALIEEQRQRIARGEEISCYVDYLLSEERSLTEEQLIALVWESIIETSDTTLVTTEWAMYELAKNQMCQDLLYREIQEVCGSKKINEEHLPNLLYLSAIFHETLRFHSPAPIIPPRHVHEDTQLGGYNIPAGTDIILNLYACNMHKKDWEEPEKWKPERFLSSKYEQMDMYKTMAFGGGKRVCAGSLQAMLISCTAIGRLIQEFHWKLKDGEEDNISTMQLTTHKLYPMQAYVRPRESNGLV